MKPRAGHPLYLRSLAAVQCGASERAERWRWRGTIALAAVLSFVAGFTCGALIFGGWLR